MDDENISGSGSGSLTDPDIHKPDHKISKEKPTINKSPVLYLRRRRNNDYHRAGDSGRTVSSSMWFPGREGEERKVQEVDNGSIYPNHSSVGRVGNQEWVKFRDYKRQLPKWIKQLELRIDGE